MNKLITTSLLASAAVASAATISYTGSVTANGTYADINLAKFNASYGTLTGVMVEVVYSNFGGSFSASSPDTESSVVVNSASAIAYLRQKALLDANNNAVNFFTAVNSGSKSLSVNPSLPSSPVIDTTTVFVVNSTTALSAASYTISGSYFNYFKDPAGSGYVTFQSRVSPVLNTTVTGGSVDTSEFNVSTGMKVTYTYTAAPVPEPSTYGIALGGLALVGAIVRRRKQAK